MQKRIYAYSLLIIYCVYFNEKKEYISQMYQVILRVSFSFLFFLHLKGLIDSFWCRSSFLFVIVFIQDRSISKEEDPSRVMTFTSVTQNIKSRAHSLFVHKCLSLCCLFEQLWYSRPKLLSLKYYH